MRMTTILAIMAVGALCPPAVARPTMKNIDYTNGFNTNPLSINDAGVIAGSVSDDSDVGHGFIRAADGTFTLFDPPGGTDTVAYSINAAGDTAGYTVIESSGNVQCFIRSAGGAFTVFAPTKGSTRSCKVFAINDKGSVAGEETQGQQHDVFLLTASDRKSVFLSSGSDQSTVTGLNDTGTVVGLTDNAAGTATAGYLRTKAGLVTIYDFPGDTNATTAEGINGKGVITGSYSDAGGVFHGYVRNASGGFTGFDVAGADQTYGKAINAKGQITGSFVQGQVGGGYVRSAAGKITIFMPPKFPDITPAAINAGGMIVGQYFTDQGAQHAFLRTP